ncbi:MAG: phospho-N-acetylmuramoyl-pentapeptide-transferase [Actinomycetota bacterium]|jgi:phospho-N-acetylmuramoyl-pentapeptide-transferase|nr:phospho-N-acetylmuramoyl-pentapeptide-transferase [Actinomycetota bacterium]
MIPLLLAGGVALLVSLIGTPILIRWLQANGIGQPILEELAHAHIVKSGTPTMGGLMIVSGALAGYVAGHATRQAIFTWGGLAVIILVLGAGLTGLLDDWIKVRNERNLGLSKRAKTIGQLIAAGVFCLIALRYAHVRTNLSFTRWNSIMTTPMPKWMWVIWAILIIYAMTNGVNFSDGLDGLAAGSSTFALSAFVIIGFWQFRHQPIYQVPQALDLALIAVAMAGACVGFLWWNAPPARIFMGDTGALGIGAGIAGLGLLMNVQLLLPIVAGLFVLIWLSDIIQIVSFRLFHKRVFKMAPLQHHFELSGWPETTVVVRFWILAGLFTALALGIFYADFISLGAAD